MRLSKLALLGYLPNKTYSDQSTTSVSQYALGNTDFQEPAILTTKHKHFILGYSPLNEYPDQSTTSVSKYALIYDSLTTAISSGAPSGGGGGGGTPTITFRPIIMFF